MASPATRYTTGQIRSRRGHAVGVKIPAWEVSHVPGPGRIAQDADVDSRAGRLARRRARQACTLPTGARHRHHCACGPGERARERERITRETCLLSTSSASPIYRFYRRLWPLPLASSRSSLASPDCSRGAHAPWHGEEKKRVLEEETRRMQRGKGCGEHTKGGGGENKRKGMQSIPGNLSRPFGATNHEMDGRETTRGRGQKEIKPVYGSAT